MHGREVKTSSSKRSEVTISTMGRVHNPSGDGVKAVSKEVRSKVIKLANNNNNKPRSNSHSSNGSNGKTNGAGSNGANGVNGSNGANGSSSSSTTTTSSSNGKNLSRRKVADEMHETMVKTEGSSRRNITRKKSEQTGSLYDNRNKKQGGSGKGKWGELDGSEYLEDTPTTILDKNDPMFDEYADHSKLFFSSNTQQQDPSTKIETASSSDMNGYDPNLTKPIYGPLLTLSEFKLRVTESIKEYFDSNDADEVLRTIVELKCPQYHTEVVKRVISSSLDEGPRERELISRLLTCLHPSPLSDEEMEQGFTILLDSLDDLCIDIPDAKGIVGCFLARAIVDEVLPPAFISNRNNSHPGDEVVEKALGLLSKEHCTARLEKVWGPGDGRPVSELKEVIDQLIEEYLLSRELDEAARCVREFDSPHFHHELVKRGVKIAMEKDGLDHSDAPLSSLDAVAALFSFLVSNAIVSEYQVEKGISRLNKIMNDLKLDVPAAPAMLEEFVKMAKEGGCLVHK